MLEALQALAKRGWGRGKCVRQHCSCSLFSCSAPLLLQLQLGGCCNSGHCCYSRFAATRGLLQFVVCCNSGLLQLGIAAARGLLQLGGVATQGCCNSGLLQLGAAARLRCRPSCGAERGAGAALPPPQHRLPALLPSMPFFIRPPPA